jgi:hypothetical protein
MLAGGVARAVTLIMVAAANLVEVAALVGDTARATMLAALMGGQSLTQQRACTACERIALHRKRASRQARLGTACGRHEEATFPLLPHCVAPGGEDGMKAVAAIEVPPRYQPRSARDEALRYARTCYDHIAGRLGVAIAHALTANGHIVLNDDGGEVTDGGREMLARFGVDFGRASHGRIFCRPCLDWSERRYHLAGYVGAEICRRCLALGWFNRERDTRVLQLTALGRAGLAEVFSVNVAEFSPSPLWTGRTGASIVLQWI